MSYIELLKSKTEILELFRLRFEAWKTRRDLKPDCPDEILTDHHDDNSIHWGIRSEWNLVAGASMHITVDPESVPCTKEVSKYLENYEPPFHTLRRLVVSVDARGKGYASALDRARIDHLENDVRGTAMVIISSEFRVQKLLKLGFNQACRLGDFNTFPGGPSTLMIAKCEDLLSARDCGIE
ncbi:MAG: GNAT family N-acetyltransferase [Alphaproteobacteria bacterium]|nr:GNAT family N-acetyltransferase [Alphaproteobacteria bacterium]